MTIRIQRREFYCHAWPARKFDSAEIRLYQSALNEPSAQLPTTRRAHNLKDVNAGRL
jgi:hypothetical protein